MTILRLLLVVVMCACSTPLASSPLPRATQATATSSPASAERSAIATPGSGDSGGPGVVFPLGPFSAPSSTTVWVLVSNARLFLSTDGGASWTERTTPRANITNVDVSFISESEGWLSLAGSPATGCMAQYVEVWHTADGALTWERTSASRDADRGCSGPLAFADSRVGSRSSSQRDAAPFVYRTKDGGRTWMPQQQLADPPGFTTRPGGSAISIGRVHAFGSTLLVSGRGFAGGTSKVFAFRSTDGGATWSYAASAPSEGTHIIFTTASRWLVMSTPSVWQETLDAGATWHTFPSDHPQAADVAPVVEFADGRVGYMTIGLSMLRTSDGGAHWTFLKTPGTAP